MTAFLNTLYNEFRIGLDKNSKFVFNFFFIKKNQYYLFKLILIAN